MQAASALAHQEAYLPLSEGQALLLSPLARISHLVTLSGTRGAARNTITISSIIRISVTVIIKITKRRGRASGRPVRKVDTELNL